MLGCGMKRGNGSTYCCLTLLQGRATIYYLILGWESSKSKMHFALLACAVLYRGLPGCQVYLSSNHWAKTGPIRTA